jgi:hypothetical protein
LHGRFVSAGDIIVGGRLARFHVTLTMIAESTKHNC